MRNKRSFYPNFPVALYYAWLYDVFAWYSPRGIFWFPLNIWLAITMGEVGILPQGGGGGGNIQDIQQACRPCNNEREDCQCFFAVVLLGAISHSLASKCRRTSFFVVYFFGGLECVGHSFAFVAHLWFLRDVWIRTQSTAVASWRATDLATHPSMT